MHCNARAPWVRMIAGKELRRHLHIKCRHGSQCRACLKRLLTRIERRPVLAVSVGVVVHCSSLTAPWIMTQSVGDTTTKGGRLEQS